jgi:hypothetical protein
VEGEVLLRKVGEKKKKLVKVTFLNCWGFQGYLNLGRYHSRNLRNYLERLIAKGHFLCLTEVTIPLYFWLKRRAFTFYRPSSIIGNAIVAPTHSILEKRSSYFKVHSWERRNYLEVRVSTERGNFTIMTTHLEAGRRGKKARIRMEQFEELLLRISDIREPLILGADLNNRPSALGDPTSERNFKADLEELGFMVLGKGYDVLAVRGFEVEESKSLRRRYKKKRRGVWEDMGRGAPTDHPTGGIHLKLAFI